MADSPPAGHTQWSTEECLLGSPSLASPPGSSQHWQQATGLRNIGKSWIVYRLFFFFVFFKLRDCNGKLNSNVSIYYCSVKYSKSFLCIEVPSLISKSLAASSDPRSLNSTSPLSVTIMVRSAMSTKQPTTSPLCHGRPRGSMPWWYHWAWKQQGEEEELDRKRKKCEASHNNRE